MLPVIVSAPKPAADTPKPIDLEAIGRRAN
jgi:hypothetical protein